MFQLGVTTIACLVIIPVALAIHRWIVYPIWISPLSKVPHAHWSCGVSPAWMLWTRFRSREIATIHEAHRQLGPVIRLGPNEISVNCVKGGIQTIYSGGFEKHSWYSNLFENYGVPNMFSTSESKPHSLRKRMLSNIYSKSYIQNSKTMAAISKILILDRFLPNMKTLEADGRPFDIFAVFSASTMDFVTSYQFGVAATPNMMAHKDMRDQFLQWYNNRQSFNFWPQEMPRFTRLLKGIGIAVVPRWVDSANREIEAWTLSMCSKADQSQNLESSKTRPEDTPEVYQQMKRELCRAAEKYGGLQQQDAKLIIASEMLDHFTAGFDTSGITLTYFVHEISKRQDIQTALRDELQRIESPLRHQPAERLCNLPAPKDLDKLPLLSAVIQETLRLRAAIPAPQPRITPVGGCILGPGEYRVPGGVRVSAQAHSLHRNAEVFDEPESWKPERWLVSDEARLKEMNRWFWAFGSGGRMCIGSNLALYQMKYIIAALYSNWTTHIVDDTGIQQMDCYTAPPTSGKLMVTLKPAPWVA